MHSEVRRQKLEGRSQEEMIAGKNSASILIMASWDAEHLKADGLASGRARLRPSRDAGRRSFRSPIHSGNPAGAVFFAIPLGMASFWREWRSKTPLHDK